MDEKIFLNLCKEDICVLFSVVERYIIYLLTISVIKVQKSK